jgi:hypothetical protein
VFTDLHTAARLLIQQTGTGLGKAFARPSVADHAVLVASGVCPNHAIAVTGVGMSRGDPAPR